MQTHATHGVETRWIRRTVQAARWGLVGSMWIALATFVLLLFAGGSYGAAVLQTTVVAALTALTFLILLRQPRGQSWQEWLTAGVTWASWMTAVGVTFTVAIGLAIDKHADAWGVYGLYFLLPGLIGGLALHACKINLDQREQHLNREQALRLQGAITRVELMLSENPPRRRLCRRRRRRRPERG